MRHSTTAPAGCEPLGIVQKAFEALSKLVAKNLAEDQFEVINSFYVGFTSTTTTWLDIANDVVDTKTGVAVSTMKDVTVIWCKISAKKEKNSIRADWNPELPISRPVYNVPKTIRNKAKLQAWLDKHPDGFT